MHHYPIHRFTLDGNKSLITEIHQFFIVAIFHKNSFSTSFRRQWVWHPIHGTLQSREISTSICSHHHLSFIFWRSHSLGSKLPWFLSIPSLNDALAYFYFILMSVIYHIVVQVNSSLIIMTDNRIKVEGIRKSAYNRLLILALVFFGSTRWSARTCITIGNILHLINIRYGGIYSIRVSVLRLCWSCRNGHINFVNYLISSFV